MRPNKKHMSFARNEHSPLPDLKEKADSLRWWYGGTRADVYVRLQVGCNKKPKKIKKKRKFGYSRRHHSGWHEMAADIMRSAHREAEC